MLKIKVNANTCQVCGGYADWDTSYGRPAFIVCRQCSKVLQERGGRDWLNMIFAMGEIREGLENK